MSKEATIICIDVGRSMGQTTNGKTSKIEEAKTSASLFIQQKIMDGKKTEQVGLILFGTKETFNELAEDEEGQYSHVFVHRNITQPDVELLRSIDQEIKCENSEGDFIDALVVGMDLLEKLKGTYTKRIILISDLGSSSNPDMLDVIIDHMNKREIKLQLFILDMEENESGIIPSNSLSETQIKNHRVVIEIENQVKFMELIPMKEALERLSYFRSRNIRQTSVFRGLLDIGEMIKIPIWAFNQTSESKPPTFHRIFQQDTNELVEVNRDQKYIKLEDDTELSKDELVKAYRYGKTLVPFSKIDETQMSLQNEKCMKVLGFCSANQIPRHHFMAGVVCVSPKPGSKEAEVALSSFIHALYETDKVAIVRYVFRAGKTAPKLGMLFPHIKKSVENLYFVQLPFAEDLRSFTFASLKRFKPSEQQLKDTENFINSLDLSTSAKDSEGNPEEELKPSDVPNILIHRLQEAIKFRALNPGVPLPPPNKSLDRLFSRNEEIFHKARNECESLRNSFKLKKLNEGEEQKTTLKTWRNLPIISDDERVTKRIKVDDIKLDMKALTGSAISKIGTVDPIGDYKAMINRRDIDLCVEATDQMAEIVISLVNNSILDQSYEKALECLKALRQGSIVNDEVERFNKLMVNLKNRFKGKRGNGFWELIVKNRVTLVCEDESEDTLITKQEAEEFIGEVRKIVDDKPSLPLSVDKETEDLLAEMD